MLAFLKLCCLKSAYFTIVFLKLGRPQPFFFYFLSFHVPLQAKTLDSGFQTRIVRKESEPADPLTTTRPYFAIATEPKAYFVQSFSLSYVKAMIKT